MTLDDDDAEWDDMPEVELVALLDTSTSLAIETRNMNATIRAVRVGPQRQRVIQER